MTDGEQATLILAREIGRLADSIDHLAVASQAVRLPASSPAGPPAGTNPPPGPPAATGPSVEEKMGKKVFAICKQNGWDIGDIGERVTGRKIGSDSRTWSKPDLSAVLDQMKDWGFP